MRQHRHGTAEQRSSVPADPLVRFDILVKHGHGFGRQIATFIAGAKHPVERPH